MSLLLGIFLIQALPTAPDVSHAVAIDPEHTLVLIGGRKMNYPAMGEYGMNIVGLSRGESLRLAISEKSGRTWDLGDPSIGLGCGLGRFGELSGRRRTQWRSDSIRPFYTQGNAIQRSGHHPYNDSPGQCTLHRNLKWPLHPPRRP